MSDAPERSWEFLQVLEKVEGRPALEIAEDVASPMVDTQSIRTFPQDEPTGYVSLAAGVRALEGIRSLFALAGRVEVEGGRFAYHGNHPRPVGELLEVVQLGPTKPGSYIFTTRLPLEPAGEQVTLDGGSSLPRRSSLRLFHAVSAAREAIAATVRDGQFSAFEDASAVGVSANLCDALSDLAGISRTQPFELGFRWGRGLPADAPATTVAFGTNAGAVLRNAAKRLWQLDSSGAAEVTGLVESLHDDPRTDDRWRVRVRGEVTTGDATAPRTVWLRLSPGQYQQAVDAHLARRIVQARGAMVVTGRRTEIVVDQDGLDLMR
jgi:hypothetical protein